jgi:hypothetical protein
MLTKRQKSQKSTTVLLSKIHTILNFRFCEKYFGYIMMCVLNLWLENLVQNFLCN